ncbi:MAG: hypothetical protein Q7U35_11925 [Methanobacteriaceae archaeon]|nr:hypothetical protein [Methanobacteriaceae archaeon]MDP2836463.1 hypothetical protein [Methanobacteriaceae archaeon]MDP3035664.1 hypothetical protein [Methanobacteriaceae archaeon]MDP3486211.1 hypothetical protein [Methanobacteriaceae archaeon]MDP3624692.1 hypothetical protein [Methanobacteriaceae archaeon]
MINLKLKEYDKEIALIFAFFTMIFLFLMVFNSNFFTWAFERHQNILSWYIRPLFLIPFCYFAYKRTWAGISATIFFLFTSMFYFPTPEVVSQQSLQFLQVEKDYLTGDWGLAKIVFSLLVPISFIALGAAFWKRNLLFGISVIVLMAVLKIIWSVAFGGQAGMSIIIPAIVGLIICSVLIYFGFKRLEKNNN